MGVQDRTDGSKRPQMMDLDRSKQSLTSRHEMRSPATCPARNDVPCRIFVLFDLENEALLTITDHQQLRCYAVSVMMGRRLVVHPARPAHKYIHCLSPLRGYRASSLCPSATLLYLRDEAPAGSHCTRRLLASRCCTSQIRTCITPGSCWRSHCQSPEWLVLRRSPVQLQSGSFLGHSICSATDR